MGGFQILKNSVWVKVFEFLLCLRLVQRYYSIRSTFQSAFVIKFILRYVLKCKKCGYHFFHVNAYY